MRKLYSLFSALAFMIFIAGSANAQAPYCGVSSNWSYGGISQVTTSGGSTNLSSFTSTTPSGGSGYLNYTAQTVTQTAGASFNLTVRASWDHTVYIDWNGDNDFFDPGEQAANFDGSSTGTTQRTYTINIPVNAAIGNTRLRVASGVASGGSVAACGSANRGQTEDYTLNIQTPPPNDASATLAAANICSGTNDFEVRITNRGTNTLNSVTVSGAFATTNYGPTTYSGLGLATGEDTVLVLGQYTATSGNNYAVSCSSSLPNGLADGNTANDSYSGTLTPAMNGVFTIGGSSPDYNDFNSAWTDLLSLGVCDSTTFHVRSGNYNQQLYLRNVSGADLVDAPVIFMADTGATTNPRITYTSSYGIWARDANGIIVKDMEVSSANNRRVYFTGSNSNLIFEDNIFNGSTINSTSTFYATMYTRDGGTNVSFNNNEFNDGSYGFYWLGGGNNNAIDGNTFNDWYRYSVYANGVGFRSISENNINNSRYTSFAYGIYCIGSDNMDVHGNRIEETSGSAYGYMQYYVNCNNLDYRDNWVSANTSRAYWYAIYARDCDNSVFENNYHQLTGTRYGYGMYLYRNQSMIVNANEIDLANTGGTTYGLFFNDPAGTTNNPCIVSNNMVYQSAVSASSITGIYVSEFSNYDNNIFAHNAVNILLGNTSSEAIYWRLNGTNNSLRNNVLVNQGPGYALYGFTSTAARDNNCYYTGGSTLAYLSQNLADLSALQGVNANDDQNSMEYFPDFIANDDLRMFYDKTIDGSGSPAATFVPEDIDGDQRDAVTPDIGLDEYVVPRNSVALISIDNPVNPICALGGLYDVSILNVGTGNLNTFNVVGEVRHLGGGSTPLTTYTYNGNLNPNQDASFNAGNYTTGFVNGDTLVLWVDQPNGVTDSILNDDTLMVGLTEGIRGTFTVGDTTGGNPNGYDYGALSDAQHLLDSVGAICDTVIFEIADGSYAESITLPSLVGSSSMRPVIFRGMNGDASLVDIRSGAPATVTIDGGDNYIFEDLTIRNTNNGRATIWMINDNDNITVQNCVIENATTNSTSTDASAIRGDQTSQNGIVIRNNTIDGGSHAVSIGGNTPNENNNIMVYDNMINDPYRRGIQLNYVKDYAIKNNHITSSSSYGSGEGIYIENSNGQMEVSYNIFENGGDWPAYGIRMNNVSSLSSSYAKIANNQMHIGNSNSGNTYRGFWMNNTSFMDINHNTVAMEGFGTGSATVYINGGGANELRNNNFANMGGGRAIEVYSSYSLTYSDYNNYYSNGTQVARFDSRNFTSFADWQTTTGLDMSSVSVDPLFYSMTDLKVCAADLDDAGISTYVTMDIQGQMRNTATPDIGADEFTAPANFALPADTVICKGDQITFNALLNDGSFAIWNNFQPSPTFTVSTAGTYRVFASNVCGQAIDSITITENAPATLQNDTHICANTSIVLDPQVPNANYAWSTGAATPTLNVAARGVYAVEVTDSYGCVTTDTVAVTQSRAVSLPADTAFCAGNTYTINANVGQGTYFWSPTGQTGPVIFASTSGNYIVSYVDNFGCQSTDDIMVDVVEEPNAEFSYFNQYYSVAFNDMSTDANSYLWVFGDGDSSTAANPVHIYPGPNRYRVQLFVENDCGTDVYEDIVSIGALPGFAENLEVGQFNVYPNPNGGNFTVTMKASASDYKLEVLSMEGKVIYANELNNVTPGINKVEVELDNLSSGVYFVRVTGDDKSSIQKINIQ